jgi:hypothetical protein
MPKRVIDFDAMWGSDKLASCAEWAQAEYAWLYGLADASGCFELTNLRVIWGRVAAIRRNLSLERLEQIFHEFQDQGLLFVWEENGKRYGHWTGSDVPGRLPAPSWRIRLERLAPPVPQQQLAEFMSRFSRGRAASPGGGFLGDTLVWADRGSPKFGISGGLQASRQAFSDKVEPFRVDVALNGSIESPQAQDWKWNQKQEKEGLTRKAQSEGFEVRSHPIGKQNVSQDRPKVGGTSEQQLYLPNLDSKSEIPRPEPTCVPASRAELNQTARAVAACAAIAGPVSYSRFAENAHRERDKSFVVSRELAVGQGPQCGPVRVKREVLERIRARDGSRSP